MANTKVLSSEIPNLEKLSEAIKKKIRNRCHMRGKLRSKRTGKPVNKDEYVECLRIEVAKYLQRKKKPKQAPTEKEIEEYRLKQSQVKESGDPWEDDGFDEEVIRSLHTIHTQETSEEHNERVRKEVDKFQKELNEGT